jgi:hypothetical protein
MREFASLKTSKYPKQWRHRCYIAYRHMASEQLDGFGWEVNCCAMESRQELGVANTEIPEAEDLAVYH